MGRRVDVSSFNPPLAGARHAADHNGQVIRGADGIQMRLQHGREAKLTRLHHAFLASSFLQDAASPVDEPKPKAARAPIDCDVCSWVHFKSALMFGVRASGGARYHADLLWDDLILPMSTKFAPDLKSNTGWQTGTMPALAGKAKSAHAGARGRQIQ
jgi:hypothetical protein